MAELVKIPAASAEYVAKFDRPYIGLLVGDRPAVFEGILNALLPFNFRFANTEVVNSDVPADNRVVF